MLKYYLDEPRLDKVKYVSSKRKYVRTRTHGTEPRTRSKALSYFCKDHYEVKVESERTGINGVVGVL
jgi:hypothetical protein